MPTLEQGYKTFNNSNSGVQTSFKKPTKHLKTQINLKYVIQKLSYLFTITKVSFWNPSFLGFSLNKKAKTSFKSESGENKPQFTDSIR